MQIYTIPGTQSKGPPPKDPTKGPGTAPATPGGIPGLVGSAPTSPIPGGVQPTNNPYAPPDVGSVVPGRPVGQSPTGAPPSYQQIPTVPESPSPMGQTDTGRFDFSAPPPGTPAPDFSFSTQVPTPTPAPTNLGHMSGPPSAPMLPNAPIPFMSPQQAPDVTANFMPVQAQLPEQFNAPGMQQSAVSQFTPQNVSYQGVGQVSVGDFQRYEEAALADAMRRLNPIWEDRDAAFKQEMANRGIAVGSDAYQKALESQNRQRSDAEVTALYDAMRYGLQAQGQAFGQGLSNKQLAQTDAANAMNASIANNNFGMGTTQLNESARQFDNTFGLNSAIAAANQDTTRAQMANAMAQYNANMGMAANNDAFAQGMGAAQFNNMIGQQGFNNQMLSTGFNRDTLNQNFMNQMAAGNQDFAQALASGQFGLAANNQNFNQQMQSAGLANAMEQFQAMYGLDQSRFNEGQRQFDANFGLAQQGLRNDLWRNSLAESNMGRQSTLDAQRMQLQERQLMANFMLSLLGMGQNQDAWLWGGL